MPVNIQTMKTRIVLSLSGNQMLSLVAAAHCVQGLSALMGDPCGEDENTHTFNIAS